MEEESRGRSRLGRKGLPPWQPRRDQRHDGTALCSCPGERLEGKRRGPYKGRVGVGVCVGRAAGLSQEEGPQGEGRQGGGAAGLRGWRGPRGRGGSSLGVGIGLFTRHLQGRHPLL